MTYQRLITVSIGLLCCLNLASSDHIQNLLDSQFTPEDINDNIYLVNNLNFQSSLLLPSSSVSSSQRTSPSSLHHEPITDCTNCNHRTKRSAISIREPDRFSAFSLLPSAANRSVFICPEKFGYFPDKRDCTKYFVCVFGEPLHESCTGGLYFSAELQTCDWPRNVQCPNERKNYEKSVFSTVDIGSGDDAFDYDVRGGSSGGHSISSGLNSNGNKPLDSNNNQDYSRNGDDDNDGDIKNKPNGINANFNKIIIRTHNSSIVRPIEHYAVDREIPDDYSLIEDREISTVNRSSTSSLNLAPSPPPPPTLPNSTPSSKLADGGRNNIDFEAHSQPKILSPSGIDYLTDGLPLPSPKPVPRPAIIYSSLDSNEEIANPKAKPFAESTSLARKPESGTQDRYSENHGNKINLEFDPQAPNYAEAIPPVVDSKGGIHFSDGPGGTFGIVDQLPGLLSPSVSDHSLNVFIKPLATDSNSKSRSREARLLKDNVDSGYEYIPVIAPEKSTLQENSFLPSNMYEKSFRSTSLKNYSGTRGRSASRPNGQPTGDLLAAVGSKVKQTDPENDFRNINENVTRTSPESKFAQDSHSKSMGQLLRKDGNEEFVLVPFTLPDGRRRNRGRVRVVPKIVPKNKLHQVKMTNKNVKMLSAFIEAKTTGGSVVVRAKPVGGPSNYTPTHSSSSAQSDQSSHSTVEDLTTKEDGGKSSSLSPLRSSSPPSLPPQPQPSPKSSSDNKPSIVTPSFTNTDSSLMAFPLPATGDSGDNVAYNVQWNKGTIEIPDSDSNGGAGNFIASLISNDKTVINLDNNHLTSNNNNANAGLADESLNPTNRALIKDSSNFYNSEKNDRPSAGGETSSLSTGASITTTSTTTTTPSPISLAPSFPDNTPFIGKILRTLRPQTIYSEPVKILADSLGTTTGKQLMDKKAVVTHPRPKVEDELPWPENGYFGINKESAIQNVRPVNGLTDSSRISSTTRQQSTSDSSVKESSSVQTSPVTPSTIGSTATPSLPPPAPSQPSSFSSIPASSEPALPIGTTFGPKTRGPATRKSRPTNKRLVVKQRTTIAPKPPSRPENVYPTPLPLTTAVKCDPRKCRLPDCNCGGPAIPGGLTRDETPQIVLLTFDDAVNDLNWELYEEIFNSGRVNPNGCPILGTFYTSHEWTDYGQVQTLYSRGHEFASHTVTHSFGEKFSKSQWHKEVNGQREILHLYGGVRLEDIRGMRAPFLQIGGNRMFEMLHEDNFTYDSSMPVFDNRPPFWPYTLDYALNHDCMISPCPTKSFPGVWEVGMVMWEDLKGGRCSMADSCSNPSDEDGVFEMLFKNFNRHYTTNKAPFGLFYHSAWFNTNHHRRGFLKFVDTILANKDVYLLTNWQLIEWMRNPTPLSSIKTFQPWSCDNLAAERPGPCHHPNVCNVRYQSGTRFMKTCQPCPERYPWVGGANSKSTHH